MRAVSTAVVLAAAAAGLAGCSCSEQEFSFPAVVDDAEEAPESIGSWLSFDRSPDGGRLTMAYYDRAQTGVAYAVGEVAADGTVGWAHERVDGYPVDGLDTFDRGRYASQRTAPDGTVWVAYQDTKAGTLRVAHRLGPHEWEEPAVIDGTATAPAGAWASLAIGADGRPVVAHCAGGELRISRHDGAAWSTARVYTSEPVDFVDPNGYPQTIPAGVGYADLVVAGGREILAFQDTASGDLHLMVDGQDEIVDADGNVGAWPSVWTDGAKVRIAYQDVDAQDLLLASRESDADDWHLEVVDAGDMRGADSEVFEIDGAPAILYFDGYDNDAWLAKIANGAWQIERIGEDGKAVGFHNEVVVAGGKIWVGSYDYTADELFLKSL